MKDGILEKKDGDILMGIYKTIDANGYLRRPLTIHEQVMLFGIAKDIQEGVIATVGREPHGQGKAKQSRPQRRAQK